MASPPRLMLLFKIVKRLVEIPDHCLPTLSPVPYTRAHHPFKLVQLQIRVDVYKYCFLSRTIIQWNITQ